MTEVATPTKQADEKFCGDCGKAIKVKAELCPHCGCRQKTAGSPGVHTAPNGKSRIAAAVIAFFLGAIGIHRFYLGRPISGIVYLLFFWTVIPAIIAFVEFIILLCMSDETFAYKYGGARASQ